jgi:hypothetical protein
MNVEEWFSPFGLVAMGVEGLFLLLFLLRPWKLLAHNEESTPSPAWVNMLMVTGSLTAMLLISFPTYQWDAVLAGQTTVEQHQHVGSLSSVCSTPITSLAELQKTYGIQVSLVALSEMNGVVDVRLKIIDPDKAHNLLKNQSAILINQQSLILSPHLHTHYKLKTDKIFFMFFPNQEYVIHPGSKLSLVFGKIRIEPVVVR